jgi:hypothetical protein
LSRWITGTPRVGHLGHDAALGRGRQWQRRIESRPHLEHARADAETRDGAADVDVRHDPARVAARRLRQAHAPAPK